MILIISSKISGKDPAAEMLVRSLKKNGVECLVVNPHRLIESDCSLLQTQGVIELFINDRLVTPTTVYMANHWRCDAIIKIPESVDHPGAFRSKIQQFMQDMRFFLESARWVPGSYVQIERGESKPTLMQQAGSVGLKTPRTTANSFTTKVVKESEGLIRKNLGFPFLVSLNKKTGVEVGITTTNTRSNTSEWLCDGQPWQWQSMVKNTSQVRSFVVDQQIWSVRWKKLDGAKDVDDLRLINQAEGAEILWEPYHLPEKECCCLRTLMKKLNLSVAAPEFLIDEIGTHTFIDLNPCGDWFGFFPASTNEEIVFALTKLLAQNE